MDIKAVHVAVAVNAETIPYTSLRKDAIAHREVGNRPYLGSSSFITCFENEKALV